MCRVGATTATRATRPSESIRWATWRPNVVLPAAGVAEARKASPSWANTGAAAACCQARRGRAAGQDGSALRTGGAMGCVTEAGRLPRRPDELEGTAPPGGRRAAGTGVFRFERPIQAAPGPAANLKGTVPFMLG